MTPSWSLIALVAVSGLFFPLVTLVRNSAFVAAIVAWFSSHNEMAKTIQEIRNDQKLSNAERQEQTVTIEHIDKRLTAIEEKVAAFTCSNASACTTRVTK